ncbi:MAG: hypothetical protein JW765_07795, partial [Deltaproteobacteria bacterium]|nr:hypothetical protein [Candidatus Zymogenaceae bacterium]
IDNPKVFDCPSDGLAADGDTTPDYLTDGYIVTCLTDDATGLKSDGVAFVHDTPRNVLWMHDALTGVALSEAVPEPSPQPTPAPTPEPPVPVALFSDDFSKGAADRWLITSGKYFTFGDGYLTIGRDGSTGEHRAFSGDEGWTDYVVEVVATLDSGDGYGIYFRATDPKNTDAYIFQYDENYGSGAFLFRKVQDGKEQSPFARVYAGDTVFGKDFQWYGTERKIRIEVSGNEYRAYIDGELVVVGKDDSYTNGMVGLRTWVKGATTFESLVVTELKGE